MFRPQEKPVAKLQPVAGVGLDERWNGAAARLLASLRAREPAVLEPALAQFLRELVRAKAQRWSRRLGERALGIDPEDVAQRVLLQLFEHPLDHETTAHPMRRLVSWITTVSHNYLYDLTARPSERLALRQDPSDFEGAEREFDQQTDEQYAARQALVRLKPALERDYPRGLPLLELLLDSPHATSQELARQLQTSTANIDQMRSRIRRVLRERLEDGPAGERRKSR